jgi:hypothetical protein
MKKISILIAGLLFAASAFSQNAQAGKTPAHKTTTQAGPTVAADKSKMLCKAWGLDSVEQFSVVHVANATEKADGVTLMADGTFFITWEGVAGTGTWSGNAAPYINTSVGTPAAKKMYKVISLSDGRLVLEYQTEDLIRSQYIYKPKK